MTKKSDSDANEWSTIVRGPLLAGTRVVMADQGGAIRESLALGKVYAHARQQQGNSELLDALVSDPPALDPSGLQGANDVPTLTANRSRRPCRYFTARRRLTRSRPTGTS